MTATLPTPRLDGFAAAEGRRIQLIEVAERLAGIAGALGLAALSETIGVTTARIRSDAFVVTVLGDFNSGKSTLINALLGADVLPRLPVECTALLTEVQWNDEPEAWLYRRKPDGSIADVPERTAIDRLRDLIVVDVAAPEKESPYARAEVRWPLELCRNNVVIVDSRQINNGVVTATSTNNASGGNGY